MFDWLFPPACPCDVAAKAWIEERLQWLADEFDDNAFNGRPLVLPTPEFFPDDYDGTKKSVRVLFDRVCGYVDVAPEIVTLKFMKGVGDPLLVNRSGQALGAAVGFYEEGPSKFVIRLDESRWHDPMELVGTMAHELAHVRLLGESRIDRSVFDNELLTDLTTVHFGLGIFLANAPRAWESQLKKWPNSTLRKPEYMSSPMFGWALAHLAWFRGEERPDWAKYLTSSARANLKEGLRYLKATRDSAYVPVRFR